MYAVKLPNTLANSIQGLCASLQRKSASQVLPVREVVEVSEEGEARKVIRVKRERKASWALLVDMESKGLREAKE